MYKYSITQEHSFFFYKLFLLLSYIYISIFQCCIITFISSLLQSKKKQKNVYYCKILIKCFKYLLAERFNNEYCSLTQNI